MSLEINAIARLKKLKSYTYQLQVSSKMNTVFRNFSEEQYARLAKSTSDHKKIEKSLILENIKKAVAAEPPLPVNMRDYPQLVDWAGGKFDHGLTQGDMPKQKFIDACYAKENEWGLILLHKIKPNSNSLSFWSPQVALYWLRLLLPGCKTVPKTGNRVVEYEGTYYTTRGSCNYNTGTTHSKIKDLYQDYKSYCADDIKVVLVIFGGCISKLYKKIADQGGKNLITCYHEGNYTVTSMNELMSICL